MGVLMKLLIVESNQNIRLELLALTEQQGHEVIAVDSASKVLEVLNEDSAPQLIILGFDSEDVKRADICRDIKAVLPANQSYILLLSSTDDASDIVDCLLAGANDYLSNSMTNDGLSIRLDVAQRMIQLPSIVSESEEANLLSKYTALKNAYADVVRRRNGFRSMFEHIGAYVYAKDIHGRYTYANQKVCELFGCSATEIIGFDDAQFFSLEDSKELVANDNIVMQENKSIEAEECNIVAKTGRARYYSTVKSPLLDEQGEVIGLLGVSTDITQAKESEKELKKLLQTTVLQAEELADSKELYDIVFNNTSNGVLLFDMETSLFSQCNIQAARVLGYSSKNAILNKSQIDLSPEFQGSGIRSDVQASKVRALALEKGTHTFEWQYLTKMRKLIWLEISLTVVMLKGKQMLYAVWKDIDVRKQEDARLALSSRVFLDVHEGVLVTDSERIIRDVNPAFCELTGYAPDDIKGVMGRVLHSSEYPETFFDAIWRCVKEDGFWRGEMDILTKNKSLKTCLLTISSVLGDSGDVINYVAMYVDITHAKEQQEKLKLLAHYDPLTGLPNRSLFADRFKQSVAHSKRNERPLAVCFLDLDHFKPINDEFGHDIGDQLLIQVAERISTSVRDGDTVSRQGGDEFALLLGELESHDQCEQIVNRMLHSLSQPYLIDGRSHHVTASCGIALYPSDSDELDTLMRQADQAMYAAKRAGKNRLTFFSF